jgi:hypothetical protein
MSKSSFPDLTRDDVWKQLVGEDDHGNSRAMSPELHAT